VRYVPSWLFEWFSLGSSVLLLCASLTWSYHAVKGFSVSRTSVANASGKHTKKSSGKVPSHTATRRKRIARAMALRGARTKAHKPAARRARSANVARRVPARSDRQAVAVEKRVALGVTAHVVTVNTASPAVRMTVALAAGGIGSGEAWSQMIGRLRPTAAITGTYFNTANLVPVGSLIAGGSLLHVGSVGTALVIDKAGRPRLITCRPGNRPNWSDCNTGLRAGPRLLTRGKVTLYPQWEGFRDPAVTARRPRAAVGITRHGKLLLVTVERPLYLSELARVMRALGARDAMCMDGGTSAALYCRGKSYRVPGRSLTNLLLVYDSPLSFERYAHAAPISPELS
jgi:exopolysaccharide biosynthesis protein